MALHLGPAVCVACAKREHQGRPIHHGAFGKVKGSGHLKVGCRIAAVHRRQTHVVTALRQAHAQLKRLLFSRQEQQDVVLLPILSGHLPRKVARSPFAWRDFKKHRLTGCVTPFNFNFHTPGGALRAIRTVHRGAHFVCPRFGMLMFGPEISAGEHHAVAKVPRNGVIVWLHHFQHVEAKTRLVFIHDCVIQTALIQRQTGFTSRHLNFHAKHSRIRASGTHIRRTCLV